MASPLGLEWPRDRVAIVNKINEMRLEIRNRFHATEQKRCVGARPRRLHEVNGDFVADHAGPQGIVRGPADVFGPNTERHFPVAVPAETVATVCG